MTLLLLQAPHIAGLLPAPKPTASADSLFADLFTIPIVPQLETLEESAELHKDFLEMAYRRNAQTPGDYFRVSLRKRSGQDGQRYEQHQHKPIAEKLATHGLLDRHPNNSGRLSRYRISAAGIAYVEAHLDSWISQRSKFALLPFWDFEEYADALKLEGWLILPEPGRSWAFEQAFENDRGHRKLHRIRSYGARTGKQWAEYKDFYHYTVDGYDYQASTTQPAPIDIPF